MNLYVNNTKIELAPGEQITLSKSVGRVGEIGTRSGTISADFDVLATAVNLATLGYNDTLEADNSVSPSEKQAAYIQDEGHTITTGFVQIVSYDQVQRRITLAFFGDNSDWFKLLAGKFIDELDYSDLDHDWTEANITGSRTNTSGYIYPALDYGRIIEDVAPTWDTEIEDWYPAIYRHTVIDRIFRGIGYNVAGDFLNDFEYKNAIIPFTLSKFEKDVSQQLARASQSLSAHIFSDFLVAAASGSDTQNIGINFIDFDPQSAFNLTTDRYTAPDALNDATFIFSFTAELYIIMTGAAADGETKCIIRKNGVAVDTYSLLTHTGLGSTNSTDFYTFSLTDDLIATDYIDIVFEFSYSSATIGVTNVNFTANASNVKFHLDSLDGELIPGGTVSMNKVLPHVEQIEVVKDMIIQNNLIVTSDAVGRTVNFNRFDILYQNLTSATDWSSRIDMGVSRAIDYSEVASNYAAVSRFKYANPNDDDTYLTTYNASNDYDYGEGFLNVTHDFIPSEKTIYQSVFGATFMLDSVTPATGSVKLGYIPYYDSAGVAGELESTPRIMYVVPDASVSDFAGQSLTVVTIEVTTYTDIAYAYFVNNIKNTDFDEYTPHMAYDNPNIIAPLGDGLLADNYKNTLRILNKPRMVEISARLWPHEFREIDFTIPVFIHAGNLQGYFYIDEIENYEGNRVPATVKLIQLV